MITSLTREGRVRSSVCAGLLTAQVSLRGFTTNHLLIVSKPVCWVFSVLLSSEYDCLGFLGVKAKKLYDEKDEKVEKKGRKRKKVCGILLLALQPRILTMFLESCSLMYMTTSIWGK